MRHAILETQVLIRTLGHILIARSTLLLHNIDPDLQTSNLPLESSIFLLQLIHTGNYIVELFQFILKIGDFIGAKFNSSSKVLYFRREIGNSCRKTSLYMLIVAFDFYERGMINRCPVRR